MLETKYMTVNDINYAYIDEGNKDHPTLLLLHGFPDSNTLWHNIIPKFVDKGYRVIAPDLRGYGETDIPSSADIKLSSQDLFKLLAQLEVNETHVVGHDWGAFLGWRFSYDYPTLVKSYVALSVGHPNGYMRYGGIKQGFKGMYILLFLMKGIAEKVMSANHFKMLKLMDETEKLHQDWIKKMSRPGRLTAALNWYRHNYGTLLEGFGQVKVPVLGLIGENDPALTVEQMAGSWHYVSNQFQYKVIKNAGHWLQISHQDEVLNSILEFHQQLNR